MYEEQSVIRFKGWTEAEKVLDEERKVEGGCKAGGSPQVGL